MSLAESANDPWQASWQAIHSLAWWLLERSNEISPQIPPGGRFKANPLVRIWDDAGGMTSDGPSSLTVFLPTIETDGQLRQSCVVREAIWQRDVDINEVYIGSRKSGKTLFREPRFSVRDAPVPKEPLREHLGSIAATVIPAISIPENPIHVDDVGSIGFEYTSEDDPPSIIRYEWSCGPPHEWRPIIEEVARLREFLLQCLNAHETTES